MAYPFNIDWEKLVNMVAIRWKVSIEESDMQMVSIVRHALYVPALALVITTWIQNHISVPVQAGVKITTP